MKKGLLYLTLFACCVAAAEELLVMPQYGDPTVLAPSRSDEGQSAFSLATAFMPGGNTNFTAIIWAISSTPTNTPWRPSIMMSCTYKAARSTTEGGPELAELCSHDDTQPLTLSGGTWAEDCLPATYAVPDPTTFQEWQYGCYCFNLTTDSALTLNVGGEELYIPATNGMIRNIQATTASRSVSIAAESPSATVYFGIAENPLKQFIGGQSTGVTSYGDMGYSEGGTSTNEWRMFVFRAEISGTNLNYEVRGYTPMSQLTEVESGAKAMWQPVETFEKDARIRVMCASSTGLDGCSVEVWGFRVYRGWLDDALIETMRDQDAAELTRRGLR